MCEESCPSGDEGGSSGVAQWCRGVSCFGSCEVGDEGGGFLANVDIICCACLRPERLPIFGMQVSLTHTLVSKLRNKTAKKSSFSRAQGFKTTLKKIH